MYLGYLDDIAYLEQYRDDGDENVALLEPLLVYRLAKAYASSQLCRNSLRIESAGRSTEEQQYLYDGYKQKKPGFNLAANPARIIGSHNGTTFHGSWHMQQPARLGEPTGYVYAVDLTVHGLDWSPFHDVLDRWGLFRTVKGEPWHHQATTIRGPKPGPMPDDIENEDDEMSPELDERLDGLATWFLNGVQMILNRLDELEKKLENE
jgi:hypothetical protein